MKKIIATVTTLCVFLSTGLIFSGCSQKTTDTGATTQGETIKLTVWGAADDQKSVTDMIEEFKKSNSTKKYDITFRVNGEDVAKDEALKDIESAADVFAIAHDQLGALVDAGAVYENKKYADEIKNTQIDGAIKASQYNGKNYAYPFSSETFVLYYDKSKLTEQDVKSMETILAKTQDNGVAKLGFDVGNAFFSSSLFFTNGVELFGKDGNNKDDVTFNSSEGLEVAKYITSMKENGIVNMDGDAVTTQFKSGKLAAAIQGPWKTAVYKEALGENYGVAQLPSIKFNNQDLHMKSLAGYKEYVVKSKTKFPEEAMALANFLTNEQNQLKRFKDRQLLPTNKVVSQNPEITSDVTMDAVLQQLKYTKTTPAIPQMTNFWSTVGPISTDLYNNKIPESDIQSKLNTLVEDIKK